MRGYSNDNAWDKVLPYTDDLLNWSWPKSCLCLSKLKMVLHKTSYEQTSYIDKITIAGSLDTPIK